MTSTFDQSGPGSNDNGEMPPHSPKLEKVKPHHQVPFLFLSSVTFNLFHFLPFCLLSNTNLLPLVQRLSLSLSLISLPLLFSSLTLFYFINQFSLSTDFLLTLFTPPPRLPLCFNFPFHFF